MYASGTLLHLSPRVLGCPKLRYGVYAIKYKLPILYRIIVKYCRDTFCL